MGGGGEGGSKNMFFKERMKPWFSVTFIIIITHIFPENSLKFLNSPLDTGRKLNVHKTFRRRPGCLLNVLCTFNLRPVSIR